MIPVNNVITKRDGDKNQIITNTNYDQNSFSIFCKQSMIKSKRLQIKRILNNEPVLH